MATDLTVVQPHSHPARMAGLPALHPVAMQVGDYLHGLTQKATGHGADGAYVQAVEGLRPIDIWFNPDLYTFGANDAAMLGAEGLDNLLESYRYREIKDEHGIRHGILAVPLVVVKRPNPNNKRQKYMLVWKYQPFVAAQNLEWDTVNCVIMPDISDYDIRLFTLHERAQESPATKEEIWRQVDAAETDYREGRRSPDSAPPPNQSTRAQLIGLSQSYLSKLESIWEKAPVAHNAWQQRQIPVSVAIKLAEQLHEFPETLQVTLNAILEQCLPAAEAVRFIVDERSKCGILLLKSDRKRTPLMPAPQLLHSQLMAVLDTIQRDTEALAEHFGEDMLNDVRLQVEQIVQLTKRA